MIVFSSLQLQQISTHAQNTYPHECCGLLLGTMVQKRKKVVEVRATENSWTVETAEMLPFTTGSQCDRFLIAPDILLQIQKEVRQRQLDIIGVYHSHPDHHPIPSEFDRLIAWSEYSYLIVSVHQGNALESRCWQLNEAHQFQAEEIEMISSDCL